MSAVCMFIEKNKKQSQIPCMRLHAWLIKLILQEQEVEAMTVNNDSNIYVGAKKLQSPPVCKAAAQKINIIFTVSQRAHKISVAKSIPNQTPNT